MPARLRLTLASATADHGTELDAALEVLGLIDLKGKVDTAEALYCNRRTFANAQGGDWCLALKANQDSLLSAARACFDSLNEGHPQASTEHSGHGRKEHRKTVVVSAKGLAEHRKSRPQSFRSDRGNPNTRRKDKLGNPIFRAVLDARTGGAIGHSTCALVH